MTESAPCKYDGCLENHTWSAHSIYVHVYSVDNQSWCVIFGNNRADITDFISIIQVNIAIKTYVYMITHRVLTASQQNINTPAHSHMKQYGTVRNVWKIYEIFHSDKYILRW